MSTTHVLSGDIPPAASTASTVPAARSRAARRTGYVLRGLIAVLLAMDASMKLFQVQAALEGTTQLGYPASAVLAIGILEAACLVLYLMPRTAILGAVLWTGYLGGAVATHVRMGNPLFTHTLSPIYAAIVLWFGLWLSDSRLRRVFDPVG